MLISQTGVQSVKVVAQSRSKAKAQQINFGRKLGQTDRVTRDQFLELIQEVHESVLRLEFERHGGSLVEGINTAGFKELVATYASKPDVDLGSKSDGTISFD